MSVYKVPQDVEADDKLLGPFNFRQFIYLMVAGGLIALAIFLFQIFPGLDRKSKSNKNSKQILSR